MKFVLWITGLFVLAVLVGLAATVNDGYAIFYLPPWRVEFSFNLLIVATIALIAATYGILRLLSVAVGLPAEVRRFQRQKQLRQARHALRDAGVAFFEGRFQKAERAALKSLDNEQASENKALALLIAARSASAQHDYDKRDEYLAGLDALPESLQLARHIQEADLRLDAKDPLGALAAVERARSISPNLTNALRLELKIRLQLKQPDAVLALTEKLLKAEALEPEQARRYRQAAYSQQLDTLINGAEILDWLRKVPETERKLPGLVSRVVDRLADAGEADQAATLLAEALADEDSATPELTRELAQLADALSETRRLALLKTGEEWLKGRPRDYMLLLALGRLALCQQLWGKAQSYLEASLSIQPTLIAHAELVRLFQQIGKEEEAAQHYRDSLELALSLGL
ncbi:MAG: heme biosynthesis protein HemY [Paludibacterium sp.]|uniref:heme biosynthesis HemY N-terminal domain-containing protein n=1 Tax=Paludibacterium sp. TaxID=1917523 RepID=UPI0025F7CB5E|nr:heme biosynthesis HemY N-terminal domain-containing protein [Paludibacterium sp.]MBV8046803.1 heme biosynthesis protein HemY [Paludibacterium sp.]MBV8649325.1 heme biosynthesis protein HemY [Paludibacterium sp.]